MSLTCTPKSSLKFKAPAPNPMPTISSRDAITLLVAANGDPALAAARAQRVLGLDEPITEPLLLSAIASDPTATPTLMRQMQLLLALQAFNSLRKTQMSFLEKLPNMSPDAVSRTYTTLLKTMGDITGGRLTDSLQTSDPIRQVLDSLPPEVADAVESLINMPSASAAAQEETMTAMLESSEDDSLEILERITLDQAA